jgi:hypothetical protein
LFKSFNKSDVLFHVSNLKGDEEKPITVLRGNFSGPGRFGLTAQRYRISSLNEIEHSTQGGESLHDLENRKSDISISFANQEIPKVNMIGRSDSKVKQILWDVMEATRDVLEESMVWGGRTSRSAEESNGRCMQSIDCSLYKMKSRWGWGVRGNGCMLVRTNYEV